MEYSTRTVGKVRVLGLTGNFDRYNLTIIRQWLEDATKSAPAYIVINLSGVEMVDSSGLATLVYSLKRARRFGGNVRLCGLSQSIRMLFELTRMDKIFELFVTEEDAIQAFSLVEISV